MGRVLITTIAVLALAGWAFAQTVTTESGPAKINWTEKEMTFTGDGAPDLNAPNAAAARLGAERAAKLDALRKALEALKGLQIRAGQTVGQKLESSPVIQAEVEGVIRGFKVVDTRYFSDGGVQIDVLVPLEGALVKALLKDERGEAPAAPVKPAAVPKTESKPITGLVVVAKGFQVIPVLAPKLIDEEGKDVYDVTMVSDAGLENGIASYMNKPDEAAQHELVKGNPLVIPALRSPNNVDLVVSNKDAQTIRQMAAVAPFLSEGRVVIVKD
jgi:hypothetical protein